jgi:hypothetical protein
MKGAISDVFPVVPYAHISMLLYARNLKAVLFNWMCIWGGLLDVGGEGGACYCIVWVVGDKTIVLSLISLPWQQNHTMYLIERFIIKCSMYFNIKLHLATVMITILLCCI